jgi:RNA polymerase sigma factor (sigma-70 family)
MDYNHIENLVLLCKSGDAKAKEALALEFRPLILNLSKKSFINSYEFSDIANECYHTLFKCVNLYNPHRHRFVAYAANAMKNSVNNLIRISVRRNGAEGPSALILDGKLENMLYLDLGHIDDIIVNQANKVKLNNALKNLEYSDRELISYVYFKGFSLKKYSELKGITYSTAVRKKAAVLNKLKMSLNNKYKDTYLN